MAKSWAHVGTESELAGFLLSETEGLAGPEKVNKLDGINVERDSRFTQIVVGSEVLFQKAAGSPRLTKVYGSNEMAWRGNHWEILKIISSARKNKVFRRRH